MLDKLQGPKLKLNSSIVNNINSAKVAKANDLYKLSDKELSILKEDYRSDKEYFNAQIANNISDIEALSIYLDIIKGKLRGESSDKVKINALIKEIEREITDRKKENQRLIPMRDALLNGEQQVVIAMKDISEKGPANAKKTSTKKSTNAPANAKKTSTKASTNAPAKAKKTSTKASTNAPAKAKKTSTKAKKDANETNDTNATNSGWFNWFR